MGRTSTDLCLGFYSKFDLVKAADLWLDSKNIYNVRQLQASILWGNKLGLRSVADDKRSVDDLMCIASYAWLNEGHTRKEMSMKFYAREIVGQVTILNLKGQSFWRGPFFEVKDTRLTNFVISKLEPYFPVTTEKIQQCSI